MADFKIEFNGKQYGDKFAGTATECVVEASRRLGFGLTNPAQTAGILEDTGGVQMGFKSDTVIIKRVA